MFQRQPWMQRAGELPSSDDEYFALLARAVFSAGLGPKVVQSRWEGLGAAFAGFDPRQVADLGEEDVSRILADPGVIRNRRKVEAVITNARLFLEIVDEHGSFAAFLSAEGAGEDHARTQEALAGRFAHLGRTSAAFFLFSAGWRQRDDEQAEQPGENQTGGGGEAASPGGSRGGGRRGAKKESPPIPVAV